MFGRLLGRLVLLIGALMVLGAVAWLAVLEWVLWPFGGLRLNSDFIQLNWHWLVFLPVGLALAGASATALYVAAKRVSALKRNTAVATFD